MAEKDERAERLKAALRANLRRRKAPVPNDRTPAEDQRRSVIDPMSEGADTAP